MDLDLFQDLRRHFTIVHHIPGRMRIKFDTSIISNPVVKNFINKKNDSLNTIYSIIPGAEKIRFNLWARSIVVEYDKTHIKPELIKELFITDDANRIKAIVDDFTVPEKQSKKN